MITDLGGRQVASMSIAGRKNIDLNAEMLESGIYIIHLYPVQGKAISVKWIKS
jgi:hypothetical protein